MHYSSPSQQTVRIGSDTQSPIISNQQSAMMKTDAGTCASLSVSLLTTSSRQLALTLTAEP